MNRLKQRYFDLLARDFPVFIDRVFATVNPGTRYLPNWHIEALAEKLEAVRKGEVKRLIINLPPRALKSLCVSVAWPAWILGHDPTARVLCASYAAPLALKHSLDTRLVMNAPWYRAAFPQTRLARDQNEKHKFVTTGRGFRFATSVGGTLTGEGGNFLIIDDPQTPLQALSGDFRNHVSRWFEHTFASRLDDKERGVIVLVMQRLHADDLSGYLLEKGAWEHLSFPAVGENGQLLHPARENAEAVERAKRELGAQAFAAQYQQQPLPEEGGIIKSAWVRRYDALPEGRVVQSWDTAIKSGAQHDASCCLTFVEYEGHAYLVEAYVARLEYPDLRRAVLARAERWKPEAVLVEDRASGQQLLQDLRRESWLPLVAVQPKADKMTRMAAVSALVEGGRLFLPVQAAWLADFEAEIFHFPAARHDDQADALSQYLDWLRRVAIKPRLRNL